MTHLLKALSFLALSVTCAAAGFGQETSGRSSADEESIHLRFEPGMPDAAEFANDSAESEDSSAGKLIVPPPPEAGETASAATPNRGCLRFNGSKSIAKLSVAPDLSNHGFTWEGFFLTPAANRYDTEGGIADRFVSQFVDETGGSTRLAIGLAAAEAGGPPLLSIAFAGTANLHRGSQTVAADVWHHFAVVHEGTGTNGTLTWYLDYEPAGRLTLDGKSERTTLKPPGSAPLTIGARLKADGKVDRGFQGLLDEIRLTPRPLAPEEFLRVEEQAYSHIVPVAIYDDVPQDFDWGIAKLTATETLLHESLSLVGPPPQFSERGIQAPRRNATALSSSREVVLPAGRWRFLVRTAVDAMLTLDGRPLVDARLRPADNPLGALPRTTRDWFAEFVADGRPHRLMLIAHYPAPRKDQPNDAQPLSDDVIVCCAPVGDSAWRLAGADETIAANPGEWSRYRSRAQRYVAALADERKAAAIARGDRKWNVRHEWARQQAAAWRPKTAVPADAHPIDAILGRRLEAAGIAAAPLVEDAAFLRRLSLDVRGRIPTADEVEEFLSDRSPDKRIRVIDRFLSSDEWADGWAGYWQDVLAENPSILKPTLNNSGPFRRWIHESLRRNLPMDRFATELILMEGSNAEGGTAGFAIASQNDAPMAMKAHVVARAFLAVNLECARCHDAPNAPFAQADLFGLAALLNEKPIALPATSILPEVLPGGREPLVSTSLAAGQPVEPAWTLDRLVPATAAGNDPLEDSRPRRLVAALVTSPATPRFGDVLVNRVWQRWFGRALVEPVDSWSEASASAEGELLRELSWRFVDAGYDLKALARLIFTSEAYQRAVADATLSRDTKTSAGDGALAADGPVRFAAQHRRRLTAEQIVDSLHTAVGKPFDAEELTFDPNETRGFLNLGTPRRAWQLTSMSNERDRPALSMPVNQSLVDVLATFGWRETRPDPLTLRDHSPNALQPLMLSGGLLSQRLVRLTEDSPVTELCLEDLTPDELAERLFLRVLSRRPDAEESDAIAELLRPGFAERRTAAEKPKMVRKPRARVDWDKHLDPEASLELLEAERLVREGDPPTVRLVPEWRERAEDALWSLLNSPEFVFVP
ncbi:MAG: DUF1549 domain-containing protein [Planctomycetes bacterium]|nr:DUF1549 domain-containing protein [Planctomycetota bacterium]